MSKTPVQILITTSKIITHNNIIIDRNKFVEKNIGSCRPVVTVTLINFIHYNIINHNELTPPLHCIRLPNCIGHK